MNLANILANMSAEKLIVIAAFVLPAVFTIIALILAAVLIAALGEP